MAANSKHVFDVIVGESYEATVTNLDIDTLGVGEVSIIEPNDRALAVDGAAEFQIVQHDIETGFRASRIIRLNRIRNYQYQPYVPPRRQRVTFTFPTAVVGQEYVLHINPLSTKEFRTLRRSYNVVATATDAATNATLLANAIANDGNNNLVAVTRTAAAITLEALSPDIYFALGLEKGLLGVAVTTNVTPFPGHGTFKEARDIEIKGKGYRGHVNRVKYVDPVNYYTNATPIALACNTPATVAVTNGNAVVTGDFSGSQTALGRPVVLGDEIVIISGTTTTYRVVAITGTTSITLDRPFTGTTNASLAIANVDVNTLYDTYTIDHDGTILGVDEIFVPHITTVILLKQGGANAAAFNTLLDSLVA